MTGLFIILVLFVLFLLPFDRRFIEGYIMQLGAKPAPAKDRARSEQLAEDECSEPALPGGPYTRQLCTMLDLEVVVLRDLSSSHLGPRLVQLAIGRWNEEAWEFDVVTEWCKTWEDLEEEARLVTKSFHGIANPKYRGASMSEAG
jgi:hypothetical protein